ncbi:hypothetical protein V6N11_051249 [Hibiscus sabdariffa]|uniref:Uncharacterized protein n=1 Tax=Hibiscus sabdariffa TaxID=183260 RepID=A0ABR1ZWP9_9ROSI
MHAKQLEKRPLLLPVTVLMFSCEATLGSHAEPEFGDQRMGFSLDDRLGSQAEGVKDVSASNIEWAKETCSKISLEFEVHCIGPSKVDFHLVSRSEF